MTGAGRLRLADVLADGAPTTAQGTVRDFGTALLRTAVWPEPDGPGAIWVRRPGPHAPTLFVARPGDAGRHAPVEPGTVGAPAAFRARLIPGADVDGFPTARRYRVPGTESLATRLLREGPSPTLVPVLHAIGALLRVMHCRPADTCPTAPARPVLRMRAWFAGHAPRAAAHRAGRLLRARLGAVRWTRLATWAAAAEPAGANPVLALHGAPGLGSVVVGPAERDVALLGGEDAAPGPWQYDVGWVLGELVALGRCTGGDENGWSALSAAVVDGYGADPGPAANRWSALRVALYLHDLSAYVGWCPEELERHASFLAALVDG